MIHRLYEKGKAFWFAFLIFEIFYALSGCIVGFDAPANTILLLLLDSILLGLWLNSSTPPENLFLLILLVVSLSIIFIFPLSGEIISPWSLHGAISFLTAIFIAFTSFGCIISSKRGKRFYFEIVFFLYLLPAFLLWGYFSISHSWPQVDTLIAILQTNATEAMGYLYTHVSLWCLAILLFYLMGIHWIARKAAPITGTKGKMFPIFLFTSSLFLIYVSQYNPLLFLYEDTQHQVEQYKKFQDLKEKHSVSQNLTVTSAPVPGLFVLIIGESENRTHMSAYGYDRDTTPWLRSQENNSHFLLFQKPYSCHVQTVQSLSYALTSKNQYNQVPIEKSTTLIEAAKAAGYDTYWISNQTRYGIWDSPTTVIASGCNHQIWLNQNAGETCRTNYYDGKIVEALSSLSPHKNTLLIIHLMGNHVPYISRFPKEYRQYHGNQEMTDLYDDSIRYNDAVVEQIYESLCQFPNFQAMVYCSDHSEAIDEGLDHDTTNYKPSMTHIPFYMAFSDSYLSSYEPTVSQLHAQKDATFTNDLLFNAMLGLMHVQIKELYEPENDITSPSYDSTSSRFRTLFGKKKLEVE